MAIKNIIIHQADSDVDYYSTTMISQLNNGVWEAHLLFESSRDAAGNTIWQEIWEHDLIQEAENVWIERCDYLDSLKEQDAKS